jgi:head-tail adaptor
VLSNILKDKIQIQVKTTTQTAMGQTVTWKPVQDVYARVIPLSVQTRASYQQLNSKVSYQVVIKGTITLNSDYRFKWKDKTLTPAEPPKYIKETTVIMVNE